MFDKKRLIGSEVTILCLTKFTPVSQIFIRMIGLAGVESKAGKDLIVTE